MIYLKYLHPKYYFVYYYLHILYKVDEEKKSKEVKGDIIEDNDSILRESSVLTSVSGIIFGFLLNISKISK